MQLTKKQKKAAEKEAAKLEAEAGGAESPAGVSANDPRLIWQGPAQIEEEKKGKLKFVKSHAVVYDGGLDTVAGWRPRLEIFRKPKDKDAGKEPMHTIDLNGAIVSPDVDEVKGQTVFSLHDANGAPLIKLKTLRKSKAEVDEWTDRIKSVAQPTETFLKAADFAKEEAEAVAAEAAAAKEMEDIVVAQGILQQAEDRVTELRMELADNEGLKAEHGDDPTLLDAIVADIERIEGELRDAEAAVTHAKSELQREMAEAAAAEEVAHKERAEAEEAQEHFNKARTAADEQHAASQEQLSTQHENRAMGVGGSTKIDEISLAPDERRAYLQWLFQHRYDEEKRGSIETSQVELLLYVH